MTGAEEAAKAVLRRLSRVEQLVIQQRFGIALDDQQAIEGGLRMHSSTRLRQIEARILRKLRTGAIADTDQKERAMQETELLKMAAFKLHDCADRLLTLAGAAQSLPLQVRFVSLQRNLLEAEQRLHELAGAVMAPHVKPRVGRSRTGSSTVTPPSRKTAAA